MEDRLGDLYLEMTDLSVEGYESPRLREVLNREDVAAGTLWRNQRPLRSDYPRTISEFETLAVYEISDDFVPAVDAGGQRGHHFRRVPRPAQGILSGGSPHCGSRSSSSVPCPPAAPRRCEIGRIFSTSEGSRFPASR